MKPTIITAILALSLHVAATATTSEGDPSESPGFVTQVEAGEPSLTSIPEAGAIVLGLVGAMMLLRRRR